MQHTRRGSPKHELAGEWPAAPRRIPLWREPSQCAVDALSISLDRGVTRVLAQWVGQQRQEDEGFLVARPARPLRRAAAPFNLEAHGDPPFRMDPKLCYIPTIVNTNPLVRRKVATMKPAGIMASVCMSGQRGSGVGVGALGGLGEFLDDPIALELGNVVDEQYAVEVVDLVLQAGGEQTLGFDLFLIAIEV